MTLEPAGSREILPGDYLEVLADLTHRIHGARVQAIRTVNTELLSLYWSIGRTILERQDTEGWGTRVIDRLSDDLRREFPEMTGLSRSNMKNMRRLTEAWPEGVIGQQPVGQLPWGHVVLLLERLDDLELRKQPNSELCRYHQHLTSER